MIVPNLNPSQLHSARKATGRPQSASLRTPRGGDSSFARLRGDGQATPRLQPKPVEDYEAAAEDEPWLFAFERCLTTADIWKMGFSSVIVLGSHRWSNEEKAAQELSEVFARQGAESMVLGGLGLEHREDLEALVAPAFLRGDVLIAVQCSRMDELTDEEKAVCERCIAKFVDGSSNVWLQYDEMKDERLGAVVVVLEGFKGNELRADWGCDCEVLSYPVTLLDESLSTFFSE